MENKQYKQVYVHSDQTGIHLHNEYGQSVYNSTN